MSEYEKQAQEFLAKYNIKFKADYRDATCPPWEKDEKETKHIHGDRWRITLQARGKQIGFDFWNSFNDSQSGKDPTAYDALACISSDVHCPETFEEFCGDYGYDTDSRKAEKTFQRVSAFSRKLRSFFTDDEIEALSEIS